MNRKYGECIPNNVYYSEDVIEGIRGLRPLPNDPVIRSEPGRLTKPEGQHFLFNKDSKGFVVVKFMGLDFPDSKQLFNWKEVDING